MPKTEDTTRKRSSIDNCGSTISKHGSMVTTTTSKVLTNKTENIKNTLTKSKLMQLLRSWKRTKVELINFKLTKMLLLTNKKIWEKPRDSMNSTTQPMNNRDQLTGLKNWLINTTSSTMILNLKSEQLRKQLLRLKDLSKLLMRLHRHWQTSLPQIFKNWRITSHNWSTITLILRHSTKNLDSYQKEKLTRNMSNLLENRWIMHSVIMRTTSGNSMKWRELKSKKRLVTRTCKLFSKRERPTEQRLWSLTLKLKRVPWMIKKHLLLKRRDCGTLQKKLFRPRQKPSILLPQPGITETNLKMDKLWTNNWSKTFKQQLVKRTMLTLLLLILRMNSIPKMVRSKLSKIPMILS